MGTYTTKSGDMWDSIAYEQMGSVDYAAALMNANLPYRDIYIFPSGIVLEVPEITQKINSLLPPWKRSAT